MDGPRECDTDREWEGAEEALREWAAECGVGEWGMNAASIAAAPLGGGGGGGGIRSSASSTSTGWEGGESGPKGARTRGDSG